MQIMSNIIRAAAQWAAKKDCRYYLNGVRIQSDGKTLHVIATDGSGMFIYRIDTDVDWTGDTMLVGDTLDLIVKGKSVCFSIDDEGFVINDTTSMPHPNSDNIGKFPDWRKIIPTTTSNESADFDATRFAPIAKTVKLLGAKGHVMNQNGTGAATITFGQAPCVCILMPMRTQSLGEQYHWNLIA